VNNCDTTLISEVNNCDTTLICWKQYNFQILINTLASGCFRGFSRKNNRIARGFARA